MPTIDVPGIGPIVLVDREQLRFKLHGRQLAIPYHLKKLMQEVPPPPAAFDLSKSEQIVFPILGNNKYGDCFYAAVAHIAQCWTGNAGTECQFDENQLTKRYLQIAGGDNGLDDGTIFPEFMAGIVGPNGPRKILQEFTIDPKDEATATLCMWAFCGLVWTCSLPGGWANNAKPGAIWDEHGGSPVGGHAMILTGKNPKGYDLRTWGVSPPPILTQKGLLSADPELVVCISMDMFSPAGVAPCGANYDQISALLVTLGGKPLPPNPFPPAAPLDWLI